MKVLSNWEIARSLRNAFRGSLAWQLLGVELLDEDEARKGTHFNQTPNTNSQGAGVRRRVTIFVVKRENSPNHRLRPPIYAEFRRKLKCRDIQDVGLEAATI